ncbi:hypothetical protein [Geodermatophilus sp. URMC 63]
MSAYRTIVVGTDGSVPSLRAGGPRRPGRRSVGGEPVVHATD